MILIIGGQGSGKRTYVESLGYADSDMAASLTGSRPVLLDLHLFLKEEKGEAEVSDAVFQGLLKKSVIICNEVGCGVVPMDKADREWRDRVGRTCTRLAEKAEAVIRLCCGIPLVLKPCGGEKPALSPLVRPHGGERT